MMGFIKRIFDLLIDTGSLVYGVLPTSADTVAAAAVQLTAAAAAWTWGVYAQIAATVGTADVQIVGVTLESFVGAATQGEVQLASGGAGSEVVFATVPIVGAVYWLPSPVKIPSGTRVAARYRTATGAADNVSVKLLTRSGF